MNDIQRGFILRATSEAVKASHPFPQMAAAEAALESNFGLSQLAREGNNLFGMKQHSHPIYGTLNLPTREFEGGQWIAVSVNWVVYPSWADCFTDRLHTLERLSNAFPHYKAALEAQDEQTYIQEVSQTWSTDPKRADKVLSIYTEFLREGAVREGDTANPA